MLSILREEFLEEPIACDDPVPGTLCYFDTPPERICPFVIMDFDLKTPTWPSGTLVRECYSYDHAEKCPVLTYAYPPYLLFMCVPFRRWTTLRDDYEIVWPHELEAVWSLRRGVPTPAWYWRGEYLDDQSVERSWVMFPC